jgi:ferredoxin
MMAHVIAAPCVADYSCVDICPVGCISPRPADKDFNDAEQLYIDPDVCVDCEMTTLKRLAGRPSRASNKRIVLR